jgi:hypothetical protein
MRKLRSLVIVLLFAGLPATLLADVNLGHLPAASNWYFHVDLDEMRSSEAGKHLYGWLQDEIFNELRDEVGVDLDEEADTMTAYSVTNESLIIVIDGRISQETQDKALAAAAASGALDRLESDNRAYYHIKDSDDHHDDGGAGKVNVEWDDDGAYFTFAIDNKLIVATRQQDIEAMIAGKGKLELDESAKGALFVLSAERNLVQAGVKAGALGDEIGWDSNILRNTEHAALLVADDEGRLAIEARLVTTEKEMADSLASIVRGLISLQVFNEDMDPEVSEFLRNTSVEVEDAILKLKVSLDPEVVVEAL